MYKITLMIIDMKRLFVSVLFMLSLFCVNAQSFRRVLDRPFDVVKSNWEYDKGGNQELNYYNEDYCSYYLYRNGDHAYHLKPGKNTVFKIMKNSQYDNPFNQPTTYKYFRGFFPKEFNLRTPYALPVKNGKQTAWKIDRRESVRTMQFLMTPGDTVYATRSGIACRTVIPRQLLICHADQTFAAYMVMEENFITPGEEVRTGQPVGIAGPTGVSVSFFFLDKNKFSGMQAVGYAYSHFTPMFRTTDGDVKPIEKKLYTALVDDALIMLDMSKREQKKYLKRQK